MCRLPVLSTSEKHDSRAGGILLARCAAGSVREGTHHESPRALRRLPDEIAVHRRIAAARASPEGIPWWSGKYSTSAECARQTDIPRGLPCRTRKDTRRRFPRRFPASTCARDCISLSPGDVAGPPVL